MYCLLAVNDNKEASKAILEILHRGWICTALTRSIQKYKKIQKISQRNSKHLLGNTKGRWIKREASAHAGTFNGTRHGGVRVRSVREHLLQTNIRKSLGKYL